MKTKLFIGLAGCLITACMASAEVVSTNIVGYTKVTATGPNYMSGPTFAECLSFQNPTIPQWCLGEMKAEGMDIFSDFIQILSANSLIPLYTATYATEAEWGSDAGWWDFFNPLGTSYDHLTFDIGDGFLCTFPSLAINDVKLLYAGEVVAEPLTINYSGIENVVIANFLPRDLKLSQITAEGMDIFSDFIQFLDPDTLVPTITATYASAADWGSHAGWWDFFNPLGTSLDLTDLLAGEAVLGHFDVLSSVKINFPNPVTP
jgi:hypothetical protein